MPAAQQRETVRSSDATSRRNGGGHWRAFNAANRRRGAGDVAAPAAVLSQRLRQRNVRNRSLSVNIAMSAASAAAVRGNAGAERAERIGWRAVSTVTPEL